jgi:MarR family transcriptional regulator, negative regulator of the multidrug operon emrRAB
MSRFQATEVLLAAVGGQHPQFPSQASAIVRMVKLLYKLTQDQGNELLRRYGLTYPEYNALMMLSASGEGVLSPSQLGDAIAEKSANVTRLTTQLVDKQLIERAPSAQDRRMWRLRLTPQGEALIAGFMPEISTQLAGYASHLDADEQAQLLALLKRLLAGVEATA